ncbi:malto-oligosyltrehalose trehalohydrolase, partial [Rhizobium ruizarguesonis]
MTFVPAFTEDGILFRLWAPLHESVSLKIEGADPRPMQAAGNGWHHYTVADASVGTRYRFVLPDGLEIHS